MLGDTRLCGDESARIDCMHGAVCGRGVTTIDAWLGLHCEASVSDASVAAFASLFDVCFFSVLQVDSLLRIGNLIKVSENFASRMLSNSLLMIENAIRRRQDEVTKLSRRQDIIRPSLNVRQLQIESRRDDAALVDSTIEIDDNFPRSLVIDQFKVTNVSMLLHDLEEFDDHFADGSNHDLSLAASLGVVNCVETVVEDGHEHHGGRGKVGGGGE